MNLIIMANDPFFWPNPEKPFANGIISLKEYLKIPGANEIKALRLFSPDVQKMFQQGNITLEEYSQLPIDEQDKKMVNLIKENTMDNKSKATATLLNQDSSLTQCHTAMFSHRLTSQASQTSTPPSSPILRK